METRRKFYAVKASLEGVRPTRAQMELQLGNGFQSFLKDGWVAFLSSVGELKDAELDWLGTPAEEFLFELENTVFQKSYKIPVILTFLTPDGIRTEVQLREIAEKMMAFYHADSDLQRDFCDASNRDWRSWGSEEFARLAVQNPIYHLARREQFFHYDEIKQVFSLDDSLKPYLSPALAEHIRDIMEYRRLKYIRKRYIERAYSEAAVAAGQVAEEPGVVIHRKLVRDRIPEIIRAQGKMCETRTLSDGEYLEALHQKLREELDEYLVSGSLEELADLVEVVYGILGARQVTMDEFEAIRLKKVRERGAFGERVWLEKVKN